MGRSTFRLVACFAINVPTTTIPTTPSTATRAVVPDEDDEDEDEECERWWWRVVDLGAVTTGKLLALIGALSIKNGSL